MSRGAISLVLRSIWVAHEARTMIGTTSREALLLECGFLSLMGADSHITISPFIRWDEKAGLQRDAIRSQCSTCSRHKEKETGYEKD
jgi:hypothetical protein